MPVFLHFFREIKYLVYGRFHLNNFFTLGLFLSCDSGLRDRSRDFSAQGTHLANLVFNPIRSFFHHSPPFSLSIKAGPGSPPCGVDALVPEQAGPAVESLLGDPLEAAAAQADDPRE